MYIHQSRDSEQMTIACKCAPSDQKDRADVWTRTTPVASFTTTIIPEHKFGCSVVGESSN